MRTASTKSQKPEPHNQSRSPSPHGGDGRTRLRVSHACDRCRNMRAKCSGGIPCEKCAHDEAVCRFSDRKREQNKKNLVEKTARVQELENDLALLATALANIGRSPGLAPVQYSEITTLLQKVARGRHAEPSPMISRSGSISNPMTAQELIGPLTLSQSGGREYDAPSDLGSPGLQGTLIHAIDLDGGSGMVGYVGKMSETSWMTSVHEYLKGTNLKPGFEFSVIGVGPSTIGETPTLTYFLDELNILTVDEDFVVHNQIPPLPTALLLGEAFLHALQGSFPFVQHQTLLDNLPSFYADGFPSTWAERRLLALCNMMWATGAKWLETMQLTQFIDIEHHLIYYARARALGLDHRIQFDRPDLPTLQGMGVLAFYLFVNGSIQRAWNVAGQAIRHAVSLGLHLRAISGAASDDQYDTRVGLWHAFYRLEILLAELLGRPRCFHDNIIINRPIPLLAQSQLTHTGFTAALQLKQQSRTLWEQLISRTKWTGHAVSSALQSPLEQTSGSGILNAYMMAALDLSQISGEIAVKTYSDTQQQTWADLQHTTQELEGKLQTWTENLPEDLRIDGSAYQTSDPRASLELASYYCSIQMLLYRPFVSEVDIKNDFNLQRARLCVQAAIHMINLMPEDLVATQALQILPWWSALHYVCQAGTVLLLERCLGMRHVDGGANLVTAAFKKILHYLRVLSYASKSAYKAFHIMRMFEEQVTAKHRDRLETWNLERPPKPQHWADDDEEMMQLLLRDLM